MNWGYKIMIGYGVFVAGILFLVYKSSQQNIDLVTTDYYAKELKYQERIDETERAALLPKPVSIEVVSDSLRISFGDAFEGKPLKGQLQLYFPASQEKDINCDFFTSSGTFSILLPAGNIGLHTVKLGWEANDIKYYLEKKIFL